MKCPKCNSDEIKLVEDRKKKYNYPTWLKVLLYVGIGIIILMSLALCYVNVLAAVITFFVMLACYTLLVYVLKERLFNKNSKTATKAICKHCGHIWYLDKL